MRPPYQVAKIHNLKHFNNKKQAHVQEPLKMGYKKNHFHRVAESDHNETNFHLKRSFNKPNLT